MGLQCTTAGSSVSGYKKGDKYIDLLLANSDDEHIYILVSDLLTTVDQTYSATSTNAQSGIAVASAISNKANSATTLSGYGITDGVTYVEIA